MGNAGCLLSSPESGEDELNEAGAACQKKEAENQLPQKVVSKTDAENRRRRYKEKRQ